MGAQGQPGQLQRPAGLPQLGEYRAGADPALGVPGEHGQHGRVP
jgi:hypothetical protein